MPVTLADPIGAKALCEERRGNADDGKESDG